jgi:hypothetical protein
MGPHEGETEVHHGGPTPGHVVGQLLAMWWALSPAS